MTSTSTTLPPRKKARMEDTADPFKPKGSLAFRIDNFREFSTSAPGKDSMRRCDAKVNVRGLTFGLAVYPNRSVSLKECMRSMVNCENASGCNVEGDGSWSCLAIMSFQVKKLFASSTAWIEFFTQTHRFFSSNDDSSLESNSKSALRFDYFLDPKNGFYNEKDDSVELNVEILVDAPAGIMELPRTETIQVNKEKVCINKNQLATHSRYFHTMFYNGQYREGQTGEYKVNIEGPATVEHFKRMLDTMCPMNKALDDECIEGVLHLANQFLVTVVEGKCLEFLTEKSQKSALSKYRMADKYGYTALKNHVLENLETTDFGKKMFMDNVAEYNQLGPSAVEALKTRYHELFHPSEAE